MRVFVVLMIGFAALHAQTPEYDLLLKGGHVIDGKNKIDAIRDVAIRNGKIAAVAADIPAERAAKTINVPGLYVTPGLVDIHVHVFQGPGLSTYASGDFGLFPDTFTLRNGVTTVADAGSAGWRTFEDFKTRIIDRARTRVLAFLNIVGAGMGSGGIEQNMNDMEVAPAAALIQKHKNLIVGIKSAHFSGPEWLPYERAAELGRIENVPVMIDFGNNFTSGRTLDRLFDQYLKKGDIYTHMYGGRRGEQDPATKGPSAAMINGRAKGIVFDVGHGNGSFLWSCAVPLMKAGFLPDSISTDLHRSSASGGMKDMLNVMSKFLAMGMPLSDVIVRSTWNPAREIKRDDLGHLSVGAPADLAVLKLEYGRFGFLDQLQTRLEGTQKLVAEMTLRDGRIVYDLNGLGRERWQAVSPETRSSGDPLWDGFSNPPRPQGSRGVR